MIERRPTRAHQLAVVRGDDHRRATRVDLAEQIHDFERQIRIEVAGRLVGEHQLRVVDERASDRNPLLFAARQFLGKRVDAVLQADPFQHLKRLALLRRQRNTQDTHDERDVLEHREPGDQSKVLKNEPDAPPEGLDLRRTQRFQIASEHFEVALAGQLFAQEKSEEGRLAGPARTGQEEELAFFNCERKIAKRVDPALVEL